MSALLPHTSPCSKKIYSISDAGQEGILFKYLLAYFQRLGDFLTNEAFNCGHTMFCQCCFNNNKVKAPENSLVSVASVYLNSL